MMMKLGLLCIFCFAGFLHLHSQVVVDLFVERNVDGKYQDKVRAVQALEMQSEKLNALHQQSPEQLRFTLPFENKTLKLALHKVSITSDNFSVIVARPGVTRHLKEYSGGIFYQGTIEGKEKSMATISVFNDRIMGVIADENGNIVLGTIEEKGIPTRDYVLYRDRDLQHSNPFQCMTIDSSIVQTQSTTNTTNRINAVGEPVDIYIECDYQLYLDKGSNVDNVINYTLGFFNSVAMIYANENIHVQVSEIVIWAGLDPEAAALVGGAAGMLASFANRLGNFNGDYAHLITTRINTGAGYIIDDPCGNNPPRRFRSAVSGITNTYTDFPVYSFTVYIFAHELGHNLGSNHTHWCGWPVGALDNCVDPEGPCAGPPPVNGGTIMSYCNRGLNYINFLNGFGFFPGNKIRSTVSASPCLGACRMTIELTKNNSSCGLNNGSASIEVFDGTGDISFEWSNGQSGSTLSNVGPGTYYVTVSDAVGCQVMQLVTITNEGPVMNVALSPERTTGFCAGNTVTLTTSANNNYSYQWYKDGQPIPAATANTYVATNSGYYAINASQDFCVVTRSVRVIEVSPPQAAITPGTSASFCSNNNNQLNAYAGPGYYYQWYRNGVLINGAIDSILQVTEAGNYTAKVYAAGCESLSAPVAVAIHPSPTASITLSGNSQLCEGNELTLFAPVNAAYTYQWYRNGALIQGATLSTYYTQIQGSFTVMTTLGSCSQTSPPVNVVIIPNPVVSVIPTFSSVQKFQTQTLTASGANAYNWAIQPAVVNYQNNSAVFKPLTTTTYFIEGINSQGCKDTALATIAVIGCGTVTELTATTYSPSRVFIRWINPPGTMTDTLQYRKLGTNTWTRVFVTGESFEINGLEPGTSYEYNVIPLCSTTDGVASATKIFETTAITSSPFIRLFPNPSDDLARLEIINDKPFSLQIVLYDAVGRQLQLINPVQNIAAGQVIRAINTAPIPNGLYVLVIEMDGKKSSFKLLVTH